MADAEIVVGIRGKTSGGKQVQRTLDDIDRSGRKAKQGSKQLEHQFKSMNSAGQTLSRTLKGLVAAFGIRELQQTVDAYTNVQNRLKLVTDGTRNLKGVTEELFVISNSTRQSFESTAEVYARTALATKDLGLSQRDTLEFTKSLNQAVILSGASATESSAGLIQLSQGLAAGALRGDELRSVLEQLPAVADVIAKNLGVTRGELRKMGEAGAITADIVIDAFKNAREELNDKFGKTVPTIGQAFTTLRNNVIQFIGALDQATGASALIAKALITIGSNIETLTKLLVIAGAAWGAYKLAALSATGATILAAVAGNVVAFVQLAAGVRSAAGAAALLNSAFLIGPGAIIAALVAVGAAIYVFRKQIHEAIIGPITEVIILADKAAAALSRMFGGEGGNISGMTAEELRAGAQSKVDELRSARLGAGDNAGTISEETGPNVLAGLAGKASAAKNAIDATKKAQKELTNIIKETSTEQETLVNRIKELEKLKAFANTAQEVEAIDRALGAANKQLETASDNIPGLEDGVDRIVRQTDKFAESAADAFGAFIDGSKSAREALSNLLGDLQKVVLQETVTGPLSDALRGVLKGSTGGSSSGGGFGSFLSGIGSSIAGAFAFNSGGSMVLGGAGGVDSNTLSLNGAPIAKTGRGEVLSISPNQRGGGAGLTVNQTINVTTGVQETVAAEFQTFLPQIQEATKRAIQEDNLRGIT